MQCLYCILSFFIVFVIKKRERESRKPNTWSCEKWGDIQRKTIICKFESQKNTKTFFFMLRN